MCKNPGWEPQFVFITMHSIGILRFDAVGGEVWRSLFSWISNIIMVSVKKPGWEPLSVLDRESYYRYSPGSGSKKSRGYGSRRIRNVQGAVNVLYYRQCMTSGFRKWRLGKNERCARSRIKYGPHTQHLSNELKLLSRRNRKNGCHQEGFWSKTVNSMLYINALLNMSNTFPLRSPLRLPLRHP